MASQSWMVYLGFAFILCPGVKACTMPVRGVFANADSPEMKATISRNKIQLINELQKDHDGVTSECVEERNGIYLFSVKQDGIDEKWWSCNRLEENDDGSVTGHSLKSTMPGERGWADDDWYSACAAVTEPVYITTMTRVD